MIFPIRCFTCGEVIGHLWEEFKRRTESGEDPGKVLDDLGIRKECCRRMFISHLDLIDSVIAYEQMLVPSVKKYAFNANKIAKVKRSGRTRK